MDFSEKALIFRHTPQVVYGDFFCGGVKMEQPKKKQTERSNEDRTAGKRLCISSEITYLLAIVLLALAVAILTAADFGISMIVAPAYLLSLKVGTITFGQAEYIIQAGVFVLLCDLPDLRRSVGSLANAPLLQSRRDRPGQYGAVASHSDVCCRRSADLILGRAVLQNLPLPAGLRLLCKSRFPPLRHPAVALQDLR